MWTLRLTLVVAAPLIVAVAVFVNTGGLQDVVLRDGHAEQLRREPRDQLLRRPNVLVNRPEVW